MIDGEDVTKLPEYKRAKYLGRVFQDPMTGTAATMEIQENLALAMRRGEEKKKLTVSDLLHKFEEESGEEFVSDKAILG